MCYNCGLSRRERFKGDSIERKPRTGITNNVKCHSKCSTYEEVFPRCSADDNKTLHDKVKFDTTNIENRRNELTLKTGHIDYFHLLILYVMMMMVIGKTYIQLLNSITKYVYQRFLPLSDRIPHEVQNGQRNFERKVISTQVTCPCQTNDERLNMTNKVLYAGSPLNVYGWILLHYWQRDSEHSIFGIAQKGSDLVWFVMIKKMSEKILFGCWRKGSKLIWFAKWQKESEQVRGMGLQPSVKDLKELLFDHKTRASCGIKHHCVYDMQLCHNNKTKIDKRYHLKDHLNIQNGNKSLTQSGQSDISQEVKLEGSQTLEIRERVTYTQSNYKCLDMTSSERTMGIMKVAIFIEWLLRTRINPSRLKPPNAKRFYSGMALVKPVFFTVYVALTLPNLLSSNRPTEYFDAIDFFGKYILPTNLDSIPPLVSSINKGKKFESKNNPLFVDTGNSSVPSDPYMVGFIKPGDNACTSDKKTLDLQQMSIKPRNPELICMNDTNEIDEQEMSESLGNSIYKDIFRILSAKGGEYIQDLLIGIIIIVKLVYIHSHRKGKQNTNYLAKIKFNGNRQVNSNKGLNISRNGSNNPNISGPGRRQQKHKQHKQHEHGICSESNQPTLKQHRHLDSNDNQRAPRLIKGSNKQCIRQRGIDHIHPTLTDSKSGNKKNEIKLGIKKTNRRDSERKSTKWKRHSFEHGRQAHRSDAQGKQNGTRDSKKNSNRAGSNNDNDRYNNSGSGNGNNIDGNLDGSDGDKNDSGESSGDKNGSDGSRINRISSRSGNDGAVLLTPNNKGYDLRSYSSFESGGLQICYSTNHNNPERDKIGAMRHGFWDPDKGELGNDKDFGVEQGLGHTKTDKKAETEIGVKLNGRRKALTRETSAEITIQDGNILDAELKQLEPPFKLKETDIGPNDRIEGQRSNQRPKDPGSHYRAHDHKNTGPCIWPDNQSKELRLGFSIQPIEARNDVPPDTRPQEPREGFPPDVVPKHQRQTVQPDVVPYEQPKGVPPDIRLNGLLGLQRDALPINPPEERLKNRRPVIVLPKCMRPNVPSDFRQTNPRQSMSLDVRPKDPRECIPRDVRQKDPRGVPRDVRPKDPRGGISRDGRPKHPRQSVSTDVRQQDPREGIPENVRPKVLRRGVSQDARYYFPSDTRPSQSGPNDLKCDKHPKTLDGQIKNIDACLETEKYISDAIVLDSQHGQGQLNSPPTNNNIRTTRNESRVLGSRPASHRNVKKKSSTTLQHSSRASVEAEIDADPERCDGYPSIGNPLPPILPLSYDRPCSLVRLKPRRKQNPAELDRIDEEAFEASPNYDIGWRFRRYKGKRQWAIYRYRCTQYRSVNGGRRTESTTGEKTLVGDQPPQHHDDPRSDIQNTSVAEATLLQRRTPSYINELVEPSSVVANPLSRDENPSNINKPNSYTLDPNNPLNEEGAEKIELSNERAIECSVESNNTDDYLVYRYGRDDNITYIKYLKDMQRLK